MPRQNRVTPFGVIEASPARGLFMGNRGILHDETGRLEAARWRHKAWIACLLAFKGRRRHPLMAPGRYTELFFCDEAVALAAGHRPCAECRRADYLRLLAAWRRGHGLAPDAPVKAGDVDSALHAARIGPGRRPARFSARAKNLPDGAFVALSERPEEAWLVSRGRLLRWRHEGYDGECALPADATVAVLTPEPLVRALGAGYEPILHPSAG